MLPCNTRRRVETAAHVTDHFFPPLPVRQWVLSVPKRLRYFMQRDGAVLNMLLQIFLRVIAQSLQSSSPGAAQVDKATLHIGAVAVIHRLSPSLNQHVHCHICSNASCAPSSLGARWRVVTPKTCWPTSTSPAAVLRPSTLCL